MIWRIAFSIMVFGVLQSGLAGAQLPAGVSNPNSRFLNAPALGEQIPDLTIVDAQGNLVNIRELASRSPYTVLTLGCLT